MNPIVLVAGTTLSEGLEIQGWLDEIECDVVMAKTAREVVRFARNQGMDLLILDTALPDMEGHRLIPLIQEVRPDLPIIVTTASNSPALEQEVRRCQIVFYAVRPDDLRHLGEIVQKNLAVTGRSAHPGGGW